MKALKYIAGICLALSLTSCDDFLTKTSPDELTTLNFWRDKDDAESAMAAVYSQMYYGSEDNFPEVKWPVEAYRQDDVEMGSDAQNYPNWIQLGDFTYTNGNSQFTSYWWYYYHGISFANQVMTKVSAMTDAQIDAKDRTEIVAEARFMRAFYHMQLLLNWEKIVNRDVYVTSMALFDKAMSERPDSWNFIVDDLQKAGADLPQKRPASNLGRATSGSAYAYLGFAYLTMASEQPEKKTEYLNEAVKAFDEVKGYELESNFKSMFDGTNKNCKESIFELQFSLSSTSGAWYRTYLHRWIGTAEFWGWDEIAPSQTLMNEFKKEGKLNNGLYDARLYASVFFQDPYFNDGTGKVYGYDWDTWIKENMEVDEAYDRPSFRKFMPPTYAALGQKHTDVNIPLMRYANVLLMKAEALNDLGRTGEAIPLINDVRRVHGNMPAMTGTTQVEVQAQIEHERMIEFPLENLRWYDLRRWGKTAEALTAAGRTGFDKSKLFYPTPLTELNSNSLAK